MKVILTFAADLVTEAAAGQMKVKVNAPRHRRFRKGTGGAKWKKAQRKASKMYKKNKPKIKMKAKIYRKKNAVKLKKRAAFLKKAPKKSAVTRKA